MALASTSVISAYAAMPFLVTREELAKMPPYCTALYGKYHGAYHEKSVSESETIY